MTETLPAGTRVGRVALRVADLDRVLTFYRDAVGLAVLERAADSATLGAGGEALLELRAAPDAPDRGPREAGLFHTAFRVPDRAALGDALDRLPVSGAADHHVSEALYCTDPEGNGVEIYRDTPRESWPVTDGRVEMDTLPLDLDALRADAGGGDAAPPETTVGHVHLEVSDLDDARAFYADTLGLAVRQEGPGVLFLAAGDYHHHVGVNVWNDRSEPAAGRGLTSFELQVPEAALAAVRRRLSEAGYVEDGTVRDPDGIEVRLTGASSD